MFDSAPLNDYAFDARLKVIQVRFDIGDNLTDGMIRGGAKIDIQHILEAVDQSNIDCFEVTVFGSFPLTDKFGNSSKEVVTKANYKGETIQRINWSNFLFEDIYSVSDDHWQHPAFRE